MTRFEGVPDARCATRWGGALRVAATAALLFSLAMPAFAQRGPAPAETGLAGLSLRSVAKAVVGVNGCRAASM